MKIFNSEQLEIAEIIFDNNYLEALNDLYSSQIQDLAIGWTYYSGKIEGNTYTFVETEHLLKSNITSEKNYDEAKMLKNLYNFFISEVEYIKQGNKNIIDTNYVLKVHSYLTEGLVSTKERGLFRSRPVRILGTDYIPTSDLFEIKDKFERIIEEQEQIKNILEKAVYLHCNLARLQPFIDGNKRTARMVESIVLMNENIVPVYSEKIVDIENYRKGLIQFYETEDYTMYADYFLNKKLTYLQQLSPTKLLKKGNYLGL